MGRLPTVLLNATNWIVAANQVEGFGYSDVVNSIYREGFAADFFGTKFFEVLEDTFVLSPFMRDKMQVPDASFLNVYNSETLNITEQVIKYGGKLLGYTDMITLIPVWRGAFKKKISEGASKGDAVYYADTLINRITGSGRATDIAPMFTSSSLAKMLTMYGTFANAQLNAILREIGIMRKEGIKSPVFWQKAAFIFGARILAMTVAAMVIKGQEPDFEEDEEEAWKELMSGAGKNVGQMFPVAGGLATYGLDKLLGLQPFSYTLSPAESSLRTVGDYPFKAVKYFQGEQNTDDFIKMMEATGRVAAIGAGTPQYFNDVFFNIIDRLNGNIEEWRPYEDIIRRRPAAERK
jgi:hypothetical protein